MKSEYPDFSRNVHCVFGLPFDAVTLEQAVASIRSAIARRTPCFFSTPNLNFLIAGQTNGAFRASVVHSDLSLADGMPIVWLARLMGIPIAKRVAGSDVFEALRTSAGPVIRVYFFGGPPGVAEQAARQINAEGKSMVCVGFDSPGFGSVEDMSSAETVARINQSGADFLVVALGAAKGQAWIEHNLETLDVPAVSHLGAVVNFVAGGVQRAPRWMQKTGLEWVWRIREEPALWKRYLSDGLALVKVLTTTAIPLLYYKYIHRGSPSRTVEVWLECDNLSEPFIRLQGEDTLKSAGLLREHLANEYPHCKGLTVRLIDLSWIPSDLLGMFQIVAAHGQISLRILVRNVTSCALRQLKASGCSYEQEHIQ